MRQNRILFIITHSMDGSTDAIIHLAEERKIKVFRLNTDFITDYKINISLEGFKLEDPTGRSASLDNIEACYIRKPWIGGGEPWKSFPEEEQKWVRGQLRCMVRELINLCRLKGVSI